MVLDPWTRSSRLAGPESFAVGCSPNCRCTPASRHVCTAAFGILVFPKITLVLVFLLMALVLVVRPWGLLGRPDAEQGPNVSRGTEDGLLKNSL